MFEPRQFIHREWKNLYQLYAENGFRAGFWVQHMSHGDICWYLIKSLGGRTEGDPGYNSLDIECMNGVCDLYCEHKLFTANQAIDPGHGANFIRVDEPTWWDKVIPPLPDVITAPIPTEVQVFTSNRHSRSRPYGRLPRLDHPRINYTSVASLGSDRVLLGCETSISQTAQVRHLPELESVFEFKVVSGWTSSVHPNPSRGLFLGLLPGGVTTRIGLWDLNARKQIDAFPLLPPAVFVPSDDIEFVAMSLEAGSEFKVDKELIAKHDYLKRLAKRGLSRPLLVNATKRQARPLLAESVGHVNFLDVSADRKRLAFLRVENQVGGLGVIDVEGSNLLWINSPTMAREARFDPEGGLLATPEADWNGGQFLVLYDAGNGTEVSRVRFESGFVRIKWHPNGWVAGVTGNGDVVAVDLKGNWQRFHVHDGGLSDLCFVEDGKTMIVVGKGHFSMWDVEGFWERG